MARKSPICLDCGKRLSASHVYVMKNYGGAQLCDTCRVNYDSCSRCGDVRHLEDMRQAWCVDCRRSYDRERWARQRAARGVS
jgi:hypothetical protein